MATNTLTTLAEVSFYCFSVVNSEETRENLKRCHYKRGCFYISYDSSNLVDAKNRQASIAFIEVDKVKNIIKTPNIQKNLLHRIKHCNLETDFVMVVASAKYGKIYMNSFYFHNGHTRDDLPIDEDDPVVLTNFG